MASRRRRRRRECESKARYPTENAAWGMVRFLSRIGKLRPGARPYLCDFGAHWHIGRGGRGLRRKRIKVWQWNMGV